jgi:hypothetical protein
MLGEPVDPQVSLQPVGIGIYNHCSFGPGTGSWLWPALHSLAECFAHVETDVIHGDPSFRHYVALEPNAANTMKLAMRAHAAGGTSH